MRDYTKILAWQKADEFTVAVYLATRCFPTEELYALTSQVRRASYSVPANIVEGASRDSKRDYLHFLYIARGSLNEARYFLHLANRLGYLDTPSFDKLAPQAEETARTLTGLIHAVEKEAGPITKVTARLSSALFLNLGVVFSLRSSV